MKYSMNSIRLFCWDICMGFDVLLLLRVLNFRLILISQLNYLECKLLYNFIFKTVEKQRCTEGITSIAEISIKDLTIKINKTSIINNNSNNMVNSNSNLDNSNRWALIQINNMLNNSNSNNSKCSNNKCRLQYNKCHHLPHQL